MRTLALLLALAPWAYAQLEDDTITVTASRNVTAAPDRAVISVTVDAPVGAAMEEVLATIQAAGITAADFSSVYSYLDTSTQWMFRRRVAWSSLSDLAGRLGKIEQDLLGRRVPGYSVDFNVTSETSGTEDLCPLPALVSDARAQAQRVADAAGVRMGPIIALEQRPQAIGGIGAPVPALIPATLLGNFSIFDPSTVPIGSGLAGSATVSLRPLVFAPLGLAPTPTCSLTVQFQLRR